MKFPIEQAMKCQVIRKAQIAAIEGDWTEDELDTLRGIYDEAVAEFEKQHAVYLEWEATKEDFEF